MFRTQFIVIVFVLNIFILFPLRSQSDVPIEDAVYSKSIKTVQFFREGWEFSYPILVMNESGHLTLSFDDLENKEKSYNYTIIHCNADWTPSSLTVQDYLDGFPQNTLNDYHLSNGTLIPYMHYVLKIPNDQISLKVSGNYILVIFEKDDSDHPVLTKRFVVSENKVNIVGKAGRPILPVYQGNKQQIEFSVYTPDFIIDNPSQTVKVAIIKNNQWNFSMTDVFPNNIKDRQLDYTYDDKFIFPGGNEYRSLDDKSLKNITGGFESIQLVNNAYDLYLKPDKSRIKLGYTYDQDLNGKFLIGNQDGNQPDLDADYVNVHFTLQVDPFIEGDAYIYGAFTGYTCKDEYKMKYNAIKNAYVTDILIKQGYFDYLYVFVSKNNNTIDETYFENSYSETENDYVIYVYYRPFGSRYDKLVGASVINTMKQGM